ncbi:MAG TPA: Hpt domain-containing protein [Burkholderiales bacterium]|nr:Hpt domain-containing protein [Burkholderiales bacterium]
MANLADTTILSWITTEVDQALETVRRNVVRYLSVREDPALLRSCPEHLHQVSGALRMVGLAGATRFCEALERGFTTADGDAPTSNTLEVLDRSVLALKQFVNDLAEGQANVPMRLAPAYRDLARLQGREAGCEMDLFFPDLSHAAPVHGEPLELAGEALAAFVQDQCVRYERGLLAWLREPAAGIEDMRAALDALHRVAPALPEPRGLWWASGALVDALAQPADPEWLNAVKTLCKKLDLYLRDAAAGEARDGDALMREVLFAVAKAPAATGRMREVTQLYQLESLLPAQRPAHAAALDIQFLEVALYDLHSRLDALKSAWVRYVSGEKASAGQFRDLLASFKAKAVELGNAHLIKLLGAITLVSARLPDPYPRQNQFMVIEMASAFLLAEHVIDRFTSPAEDLDCQIVLMGGWLLDAQNGKSTGEPPAGLRPELTQQIGSLQLRSQVAKEILANLQHLEQVLDAFARDPSRRDTLRPLETYIRQVHGALTVLGFKRAAEAIGLCERMIAACADPAYALAAHDMDWIAEGLSSVGMYLAPCLHGHEPGARSLEIFFNRFENARTCAEAAPADITLTLQPLAKEEVPELLGVFLEEAREVLETIEGASPPGDLEALTTIRRGFHTLKGSGRMVGLTDLSEAAWGIEQILNEWLERKRPATPALNELVCLATEAFRVWVRELREGKRKVEIDASPLVELARRTREEAEEPPQADVFDIYSKEAIGHVGALRAGLDSWAPGTEASAEFARAAHTLASSSRTAGFAGIADLAAAIERWTPLAPRTPAGEAGVLGRAVATLGNMVDAAVRREPGVPSAAAIASLNDLASRLSAPRREEKRVIRDDIDPQLLPIFLEEARELVPAIGSDLREWKAAPEDARISQSLQRALHTLKGSARMAGAIRLGELTHLMESRIEAALEAGELPPVLFAELEERMDRLCMGVERLRHPKVAPQAEARAPAAMLRVNADTLDSLINEAGEMAIARSRMEAELRAAKQSLGDLGESVARLRAQLREIEVQADSQMQSRVSVLEEKGRDYDPLEFDRYTRLQELTRLMTESLNDVIASQQALLRNAGETDAALRQQARISRGVQQALMRMRAVPFSSLSERLFRLVRQVARELDKRAELQISGAEAELDRGVLERIAAPLEHLVRNAIAHGIEAPAARAAAGKPEAGRIGIALRQEANEIALMVSDDGGGLDYERLRRKSREAGLLGPEQEATEAELAQLVFVAGFSTADAVTEIAGRGIGMDVVRSEITAIGGRVEIVSAPGEGTTFTLYLPLTLAMTQAVLVRAGGSVLAVATGMVEQVLRLKADAMAALYEKSMVEFQDRSYPLHYFQHLLGARSATRVQGYNSVLLVRSGIQRVAVHVDELVGNQEIVVKNIGPQLAGVPGVSGATVLADGTIALIVNPVQLALSARATGATISLQAPAAPAEPAQPAAPIVMVVDDSLTVRKVTRRLLEREGYRVITAKDGVDAVQLLKDTAPDVMLIDIEMPRMDGFELARTVRGDPRIAGVPIIVITSRTAGKHRAHATELGANAFLGKPYQEAELLQEIEKVLA